MIKVVIHERRIVAICHDLEAEPGENPMLSYLRLRTPAGWMYIPPSMPATIDFYDWLPPAGAPP